MFATRGEVIQTLWIGPELSTLERLSLRSFLAHGHEVCLYTYGEVRGVPAGGAVRDAAEILPAAAVFRYRDLPSYAGLRTSSATSCCSSGGAGGWTPTSSAWLR